MKHARKTEKKKRIFCSFELIERPIQRENVCFRIDSFYVYNDFPVSVVQCMN